MSKNLRTLAATAAAAAVIIGTAGPAFADRSLSAGLDAMSTPDVPTIHVSVPTVEAPGCGTACPGDITVGAINIATPYVNSIDAQTGAVSFGGRCVAMLACVGGFTVPSLHLATTPAVPAKTATTPSATVASPCELAAATNQVCDGLAVHGFSFSYDPPVGSVALTPEANVAVSWSGLSAYAPAADGATQQLGPITHNVELPLIGAVPVTLFPQGLDIPAVAGTAVRYNLTVGIEIGDQLFSTTIPVTTTL